jgi:hypothetical protein
LAAVTALALAGAGLVAAPAEAGGHGSLTPVITGLVSPRGVDLHAGKIMGR